jgi:DNA-binding PadR family transcriptional regulator
MPERAGLRGPRPGRVLGLYALSVMDRDGPIYGYSLADRISDRTDGAWHPGAGAIYPALQSLVERGFARSGRKGRRRVYSITPQGRKALGQIRRGRMGGPGIGPDLGLLWSEIVSPGDPGQHLIRHLHHHLEAIGEYLERDPQMKAGRASLREQVRAELRAAETRLEALVTGPRPPAGARTDKLTGRERYLEATRA